jgi:hypothetical protein
VRTIRCWYINVTSILGQAPFHCSSFTTSISKHIQPPATMTSHQHTNATGIKHLAQDPVSYESSIYQKGLHYERPPFSFRSEEWEPRATARMSADSAGYIVGNARTGETARKNRAAFDRWSFVPKRLVRTGGLPDLSTRVLGQDLQFPLAIAPIGVQRTLRGP